MCFQIYARGQIDMPTRDADAVVMQPVATITVALVLIHIYIAFVHAVCWQAAE